MSLLQVAADILSILEAMYFVAEAYHSIDISSTLDCKMAVDLINQKEHLGKMCRQWSKRYPEVLIKHCGNDNKTADDLAKNYRNPDLECNVTRNFPTPPSYCMEHLVSNYMNFDISK